MEPRVGELVCYTGVIGMITEITSNPYKNIVEWSNGTNSIVEYDFLKELRQNYLDLRKTI